MTWLQERADHLAVLYEGAVPMFCDPQYPARVHFVAHAAREIYNRLPEAISGEVVRSKKGSGDDLIGDVIKAWDGASIPSATYIREGFDAKGSHNPSINSELHSAISELVTDRKRSIDTARERAGKMFAALGYAPVPSYVIAGWISLGDLGPALAHARAKALSEVETTKLEQFFEGFETQLHTIAQRTYENMDDLDEILGEANS